MSTWFKYWLVLSLLLWVVGCGSSSKQSIQDIDNSRVAQSTQGDAIAGQNVQIDKSTYIGTQINSPPEVLEQIRRFNERQNQELTAFQQWQIGIGLGVIFSLASLGVIWLFWSYITPLNSRTYFINTLQKGIRRKVYKSGVFNTLKVLSKVYGDKKSLRAFNICLVMAYVYAFLFFTLNLAFIKIPPALSRNIIYIDNQYKSGLFLYLIFVTILAFSLIYSLVKYNFIDNFMSWFYKKYTKETHTLKLYRVFFITSLIYVITSLVLIKFELLTALIIFSIFYKILITNPKVKIPIEWQALMLLIPLTFILSLILNALGYLTTVPTTIIILGGLVAISVNTAIFSTLIFIIFLLLASLIKGFDHNTIFILSIYIFLPLINALLDYLSWWVSRAFLEKTLQTDKVWLITLEVLIDAFLAVLFMLALCLLLPAGAIALDNLFSHWVDADGQSATTNWQYYAYAAAVAPFGEGLMVTLMLWTTLLPTFIHLVLGCLAIIIFSLKGQALATFLINTPEGHRLRYTAASLWLYGYLLLSIGIVSLIIWLVLKIADLPIAAWLYNFTRYFYADYGLPELPS